MKFRSLGQAMLALAVSPGLAALLTSCGGGHTIGYAYVPTSPSSTNATIFAYDVRSDSGALWAAATPATVNPYAPAGIASAVTPDGQNLYVLYGASTNITTGLPISNNSPSQVVHYGIQPDTGNITPIDTQDTGGNEAIALAMDPSGSFLYAVDSFQTGYNTGNPGPGDVTVWAIQPASSSVAGGALMAPTCTTGGTIVPNGAGCSYPVGWGPRAAAATAATSSGEFLYVTNTGNTAPASNSQCFSTVSGFTVNSTTGVLTPLDLSSNSIGTCPGTPYPANSMPVQGTPWAVASVTTSAGSNPLVYLSDYANAVVYGLTTNGGHLQSPTTYAVGNQPENLLLVNGSGTSSFVNLYVSNFADGTLNAFTVAPSTGVLTPVATYVVGVRPTCMSVDPTKLYFYVTNYVSGSVSGFTVDNSTGALAEVANSPFLVGSSATGINNSNPTCISIMPNTLSSAK